MPLLTFPLALIGLVGLPTLAAIYYLRNRFKRRPVSSLMLWVDQRAPREGGARVQKLQTPLLFFLELAAIILLVIAATAPRWLGSNNASPLYVVLDDSMSMLADDGDMTVRERGIERALAAVGRPPGTQVLLLSLGLGGAVALGLIVGLAARSTSWGLAVGGGAALLPLGYWAATTLAAAQVGATTLVRAGPTPQVLARDLMNPDAVDAALDQWACQSASADLGAAVTFAGQHGGPRARLLVITDHPTDRELGEGAVVWAAVGAKRPNVAITNALRAESDTAERYVVELANLSDSPATTTLSITDLGTDNTHLARKIALAAEESKRFTFDLEPGAPALRITLSEDALAIDNTAVLLPPDRTNVQVQVKVADERLRSDLVRAIRATERAELATRDGHLLITDDEKLTVGSRQTWPVTFVAADQPSAYVGPFVIDKAHPLARGLALAGVVWSAGRGDLPGVPVVTAGNTPLITDRSRLSGRHDLTIRLNASASTLTRTVNWPILLHNLVRWRAAEAPGIRQTNVRLGTDAAVTVAYETDSITVTDPSGDQRTLDTNDLRILLPADRAGVWQVEAGEQTYRFAVNALARDESDLRGTRTSESGSWLSDPDVRAEYVNITWLPVIVALAVLAAHAMLVARSSGPGEARQ